MNFKELPKGLEFREGLTIEMITARLDEASIKYDLDWEGYTWIPSRKYFRESNLDIDLKRIDEVLKILGKPDKRSSMAHFYIARYKVNPEFSWKDISGTLTLDKGDLVEQVKLTYLKFD